MKPHRRSTPEQADQMNRLFDPRGGIDRDLCECCQAKQAVCGPLCEECYGVDLIDPDYFGDWEDLGFIKVTQEDDW